MTLERYPACEGGHTCVGCRKARRDAQTFGAALTWLERRLPNGIQLVAQALSEGRVYYTSQHVPGTADDYVPRAAEGSTPIERTVAELRLADAHAWFVEIAKALPELREYWEQESLRRRAQHVPVGEPSDAVAPQYACAGCGTLAFEFDTKSPCDCGSQAWLRVGDVETPK